MPAGPGETLLITCFADVHYYFNDPALKPPHHRFDKGSYVYLFYNPTSRQTKLEIANSAGTPDQDAFYGYLNVANVRYSHVQPNLCTILINTSAVPEQSTWHLPAFDQRGDQKYMYKLHALDLYMWTEKDASNLINQLKNVLSPDRLDIKDAQGVSTPHAEHRDSMSPVVQQLERTAIGSHFPPRAASAVSAQSIPGPPTPMSTGGSPQPTTMGYNPAAPSAPEPVSYREKTPPPPDDGSGNGLKGAAAYEGAPLTQYPSAAGQHQSYFSGPPQHSSTPSQSTFPGPPGSVPPPPQQKRAPSFGPMAQSTLPQSPPPHQQSFQRQSSYGPNQTQYATYNPSSHSSNYPGSPGYNPNLPPTPSAPPAYSGPMQSPGLPPPPPQQQPTPVGGYSNYSYGSAQESHANMHNTHGAYTGDVHNQAYRPTEAEALSHHSSHHKPQRHDSADGKQSKLQAQVGKAEGKVGKYLNKLDKLW